MLRMVHGLRPMTFLIDAIKTTPDDKARYEMMHMAEDMIMSTGCITPLYHYTGFLNLLASRT